MNTEKIVNTNQKGGVILQTLWDHICVLLEVTFPLSSLTILDYKEDIYCIHNVLNCVQPPS
jgi:hypothetical protein